MSSTDPTDDPLYLHPTVVEPDPVVVVPPPTMAPPPSKHRGFLLRHAPYFAMLLLALGGVGYSSLTRRAITDYWDILAPVFGVICIIVGWQHAVDRRAKIRLLWTQVLHWVAFLIAMRVLYLPSVRGIVSTNSTGLDVLTILALGTFVAGVHALSWRICLVGGFLALSVPGIAWLEQSVLIVTLAVVVLLGIVGVFWWTWKRDGRAVA